MDQQPTVTMTLAERDALKERAGSLLETVKAYWPLVVLLAGAAGLGGATVAPKAAAPVTVIEEKKPVAPADAKAAPAPAVDPGFQLRMERFEKALNDLNNKLGGKVEHDVSLEVAEQENIFQQVERLQNDLQAVRADLATAKSRVSSLESGWNQAAPVIEKTKVAVEKLQKAAPPAWVEPTSAPASSSAPPGWSSGGASAPMRRGLLGRRGASCAGGN